MATSNIYEYKRERANGADGISWNMVQINHEGSYFKRVSS
jgi:hypothetical protein